MTRQFIDIANGKWGILVYHGAAAKDAMEVRNALEGLHCPKYIIDDAVKLLRGYDKGFSFTFTPARMSMILITQASSKGEYINTAVHECKHVLSKIFNYYEMDEDSETASYLLGNLVMEISNWATATNNL